MAQNESNPYVGPRPFERKAEDSARFFGRAQETEEIVSLIFGHPVTLVYAQSGAGKTSLFNASVALKLEENGFDVLPLTRVGGVVPEDVALEEIKNLYIFNALLKMDSHADTRMLLSTSLCSFLEERVQIDEDGQPRPRVIIFDQFEELFTYTPENWHEQRNGFFLQVNEALEADPLLRVVFVIREDFLAELDPYSRILPERLRTRYRLERLGEQAALRAIKDPLASTFRKFAPDVAEDLVKELLVTRTVDAMGKMAEIVGQYVEPVQLQVICVTLWSTLEPECVEIQKTHLANFNVNDALSNFYKSAIESAVKETDVSEVELRNWFGNTLITPMRTRSTVFRGEKMTGGIENTTVDFLEGRHIIRAEFRAGARWYELTHDRMIEPITKDNRQWFDDHLSPLQKQAALWDQQERIEGLLLRGEAFLRAEQEAKGLDLSAEEQAFLDACRKARAQEVLNQTRNNLIRFLAIGATAATIIAVFFWIQANNLKIQAKNEARVAEANQFAAYAESNSQHQLDLALLFGIEGYRLDNNYQTRGALLDALRASPHFRQFLFAHRDAVASVAFSPDGKILASGSNDKTIILWDVRTQSRLGSPLMEHTDAVYSVAFSPDGKILASAGADKTIILWNPETQKPIGKPLRGHADIVYSVTFSPDGKTLASGSWDDSVILWDVGTERQRCQLFDPDKEHRGNIVSVAFSRDGKTLASGSWNARIMLWDVASCQPIGQPLQSDHGEVESVAFSPDGQLLAAANYDGTVTLWDTSLQQQNGTPLMGHTSWVSSIAFSPNGKMLVSCSADGTIILWNVATRQQVEAPLRVTNSSVYSVAFSPDGKMIASGGLDKAVTLWDTIPNQLLAQPLTIDQGKVNSVTVSRDGKLFAAGTDQSFALWDASTRHLIGAPHLDHNNLVETVAFNADGRLLASGGYSTGVLLWDTAKGQPLKWLRVENNRKTYDYVYSLAFSPDGKTLASGNWEDTVILWDMTTYQPIGEPLEKDGHTPSTDAQRLAIKSLAFSPDGKILASGSEDNTIVLWDMVTRKAIGKLTGHTGPVYSVVFSPDGKILASASYDNSIILWNIQTRQPITALPGHKDFVISLAFSPDGRILASGGNDKTIILWDMNSLQPIGQPLAGANGPISSLTFAPDGKSLVSGSNAVIVWNLDPESWVKQSCQRAGRNFTRAEWSRYFPNEVYRATCAQWPLEAKIAPTPIP